MSPWRWHDWPLRWRMSAWVGGLSLIVLLAAVLYAGHVLGQGRRQLVQRALEAQAQAAATLLANHIRERVIELQVLAQSPQLELNPWPNDELAGTLQRRLTRTPGYRWLALLAVDGHPVATAPAELSLASGARLVWPEPSGTSKGGGGTWVLAVPTVVGDSAVQTATMPDLDLLTAVRQRGGGRKGGLRARVSGARLVHEADAVVQANANWPDLHWMLVDAQGQLLHRSSSDAASTQDRSRDFVATAPVSAGAPVALGWSVVVRQPQATALAELHQLQRRLALGALVAAAGVGLAAGWVARRFSRPIEQLALALQAVPSSTLPAAHALQAPEWRQLLQAIEAMTRRLLAQQADLQRLNTGLEATVRTRTLALAQANAELARQADTDALTGLANRRRLEQRLLDLQAEHRRHGRGYGLIIIDADHFKQVNDQHGHAAGDAVLQRLARRLQAQVRATDLLARYGGEEFVLLVTDSPSHDDVLTLAEKLRRAVQDDTGFDGPGRLTISLGASAPTSPDEAASRVLQRADEALYLAKSAGRNRTQAVWNDALHPPEPAGNP